MKNYVLIIITILTVSACSTLEPRQIQYETGTYHKMIILGAFHFSDPTMRLVSVVLERRVQNVITLVKSNYVSDNVYMFLDQVDGIYYLKRIEVEILSKKYILENNGYDPEKPYFNTKTFEDMQVPERETGYGTVEYLDGLVDVQLHSPNGTVNQFKVTFDYKSPDSQAYLKKLKTIMEDPKLYKWKRLIGGSGERYN